MVEKNEKPKRLTDEEKQKIWDGLAQGKSKARIAEEVGVSQVTVYRFAQQRLEVDAHQPGHPKVDVSYQNGYLVVKIPATDANLTGKILALIASLKG